MKKTQFVYWEGAKLQREHVKRLEQNDLSTRSTAKIDRRLVLPSYRFVGKWYIYEQNCKDKQPTDRDKKTKLVEKYSLDW